MFLEAEGFPNLVKDINLQISRSSINSKYDKYELIARILYHTLLNNPQVKEVRLSGLTCKGPGKCHSHPHSSNTSKKNKLKITALLRPIRKLRPQDTLLPPNWRGR